MRSSILIGAVASLLCASSALAIEVNTEGSYTSPDGSYSTESTTQGGTAPDATSGGTISETTTTITAPDGSVTETTVTDIRAGSAEAPVQPYNVSEEVTGPDGSVTSVRSTLGGDISMSKQPSTGAATLSTSSGGSTGNSGGGSGGLK